MIHTDRVCFGKLVEIGCNKPIAATGWQTECDVCTCELDAKAGKVHYAKGCKQAKTTANKSANYGSVTCGTCRRMLKI